MEECDCDMQGFDRASVKKMVSAHQARSKGCSRG